MDDLIFCRWDGTLYNRKRFLIVAIGQQEKKKPRVTTLLSKEGYGRGRRYGHNYDHFLTFGQVILKVPSPTKYLWRTAMAQLNVHLRPQSHSFAYSGYLARRVSDRGWSAQWLYDFSGYIGASKFALI